MITFLGWKKTSRNHNTEPYEISTKFVWDYDLWMGQMFFHVKQMNCSIQVQTILTVINDNRWHVKNDMEWCNQHILDVHHTFNFFSISLETFFLNILQVFIVSGCHYLFSFKYSLQLFTSYCNYSLFQDIPNIYLTSCSFDICLAFAPS